MGMIKLPQASLDFFYENSKEIFSSGELAEGKWNKKVADWSCEYTGASHSLAVNSNGAGLFTLLKILKHFKSKKRIFLQSNTMYGVSTIAKSSGLKLCDYINCSLDYLMPSYEQVKNYLDNLDKPEECIFLLTHIGGWVNPDIEPIAEICKNKGVSLIEDCAHSLGATLRGKHTGLFGDAGVYSLYATKAIPVGEGGIILTNNDELNEIASKFIMYDRFEQKLDIGINLRMSEINALLSYSVLKETEAVIKNKYLISEKYCDACREVDLEYIDPKGNDQRSNLYKFILLSRSIEPDKTFKAIKTRTSQVYDYALGGDAEQITKRHICLPIWYNQPSDVTEKVLKELCEVTF